MPYLDSLNRELPFQGSSETSRDAAVQAHAFVGEQGEQVCAWLSTRTNATQKEASAALGIGRPSICARFRALELAGRIRKLAVRRNGCAAYEARRSA